MAGDLGRAATLPRPKSGRAGLRSRQTEVLHPRHVPVPERRGFARWSSGGLHRDRHYRALQTDAGFNVLHPMGWDAFGLPAEQYAIKSGQHPAITTRENVAKFKSQLKRIGFS